MTTNETFTRFTFQNRAYRVPMAEARECCFVHNGVIELPGGKLVVPEFHYGMQGDPLYVIHRVEEYVIGNRDPYYNPDLRVNAELVPEQAARKYADLIDKLRSDAPLTIGDRNQIAVILEEL